jgi:hypothetical protein
MPRQAKAIHFVEKSERAQNLRCVDPARGEWETCYWWVSNATANSLVLGGGMVYVHRGTHARSKTLPLICVFRKAGVSRSSLGRRFRFARCFRRGFDGRFGFRRRF